MIVDWVRNLLKKSSPRRLDRAAVLPWHCNLCGQANATVLGEIEREHGACSACGSVMRFRSLMLALTERLHGKSTAMAALPPAKQIVGLGMRSEERRVGKEWQSTCRSRWSPYN